MKTRTSFTCKTYLQLLKDEVPLLSNPSTEEFKAAYSWIFAPPSIAQVALRLEMHHRGDPHLKI